MLFKVLTLKVFSISMRKKLILKCRIDFSVVPSFSKHISLTKYLHTEFKPTRGLYLGKIPRIAKEWTLTMDLKAGAGKRHDWSSIIKFTTTGRECCLRGEN